MRCWRVRLSWFEVKRLEVKRFHWKRRLKGVRLANSHLKHELRLNRIWMPTEIVHQQASEFRSLCRRFAVSSLRTIERRRLSGSVAGISRVLRMCASI